MGAPKICCAAYLVLSAFLGSIPSIRLDGASLYVKLLTRTQTVIRRFMVTF